MLASAAAVENDDGFEKPALGSGSFCISACRSKDFGVEVSTGCALIMIWLIHSFISSQEPVRHPNVL